MNWTAELLDRVSELWQQGKSASVIAWTLSISRNAVISKLHRANKHKRDKGYHNKNTARLSSLGNGELAGNRPPRVRNRHWIAPEPIVTEPMTNEPTQYLTHLFDIGRNQCRWINGDPTNMIYCGAPTTDGCTWCSYHFERAHIKSTPRTGRPYFLNRLDAV